MATIATNFICSTCGAEIGAFSSLCTNCIINKWLLKYADEIDFYIAAGHRYNRAVVMVRDRLVPKCTTCGGLIKHGSANVLFCSKPLCKRSARRLRYYKTTYKLNHLDALQLVVKMYEGEVNK